MKHRLWMRLSGATLLGFVLLQACGGDDEKTKRGGEGESCNSANDCGSGLTCIANICTSDPSSVGDAGGPTVVRGQVGESCRARSDCEIDLSCIDGVCTDEPGTGPTRGQRGETCRSRLDCEVGLACIGGACAVGDFEVEATDNECALIQCAEAADCCPEPSPNCSTWQAECDAGNMTSCTLVDLNCTCNEDAWDCVNDRCQALVTCGATMPCPGVLVCDRGTCVQCLADEDCLGANQTCVDKQCVSACESNEDCPIFSACTRGACEHVGCQSDRECAAFTGSVLSFCNDGECAQPCNADFECDSPLDFDFRLCVDGFCADAGCETDEECRIRLNVPMGSNLSAVCRPRP